MTMYQSHSWNLEEALSSAESIPKYCESILYSENLFYFTIPWPKKPKRIDSRFLGVKSTQPWSLGGNSIGFKIWATFWVPTWAHIWVPHGLEEVPGW